MKPSFSVLDMLPDEGGIIMNETLKTLVERRSCRSYKPDPVPAEIMDQILEAGTYAATGMG